MRITLRMASYCAALILTASAATEAEDIAPKPPQIQVALLLDTSNSMDGLIEQAKTQLWSIVNELVTAERDGERPEFRVALYQYGNDRLDKKQDWIEQVLPLTDDLDKVSEKLFEMTTKGGSEYCGAVISRATKDLEWSGDTNDMKAIFIAGNEPFTQGGVSHRDACKSAIGKGVVVNTIFCGPQQVGIDTKWKEGAMLADGKYMNIDENRVAVHIDAPQDEEIERLGRKLNSTYVPFGAQGRAGIANQAAQDANVSYSRKASIQRSVTKANAFYKAKNWDLVDAEKEGEVKLDEVKKEDLPKELRGRSPEELKAHLDAKLKKRQEIQEKINALNTERKKFVAEELKKQAGEDKDTLGGAMIDAIRQQAEAKDFTLK